MNALLPLGFAIGALLIYLGLSERSAGRISHRSRATTSGRAGGWRDPGARRDLVRATTIGGAGTVAVLLWTSSLILGSALAIATLWVPPAVLRSRHLKRAERLRRAWPDAIAHLIAFIRSGASLGEACISLGSRGPLPIRDPFVGFAGRYRASGNFEKSIRFLRDELADPFADKVLAALLLAHSAGGSHLVELLESASVSLREELRIRDEIRARASWVVVAARISAIAPWIVAALMATRPEARSAYSSSSGHLVLLVGSLVTIVGYRAMLRIAQIPEDPRLA